MKDSQFLALVLSLPTLSHNNTKGDPERIKSNYQDRIKSSRALLLYFLVSLQKTALGRSRWTHTGRT